MTELSSHFDLEISHGIKVKDVLEHPEKHHWQLSYGFRGRRDKYDTPNGVPYGSSSSFATIYKSLHDDFIGEYFAREYQDSDVKAYGDELLSKINDEIGIYVDSYQTSEGNVFYFESKYKTAKKRYDNAYTKYSYIFDELNDKINNLYSSIPLTKKNKPDRRTKEYHTYTSAYTGYEKAYKEAEKKFNTEVTRYENAKDRYNNAVQQFEKIKNEGFDPAYKFRQASEDFAKAVHDDIIARGENGQLPRQNMLLAESTIRRRLKSAIAGTYRYWATGQLISAVVIKCKLVKGR